INLLEKLGLRADGVSSFFEQMMQKEPKDAAAMAGIWSSHPPTAERIAATKRPPTRKPPFSDAEWRALRGGLQWGLSACAFLSSRAPVLGALSTSNTSSKTMPPLIILATAADQPDITSSDQLYAEALRRRGVDVRDAPWNGPVSAFEGADAVVLRS